MMVIYWETRIIETQVKICILVLLLKQVYEEKNRQNTYYPVGNNGDRITDYYEQIEIFPSCKRLGDMMNRFAIFEKI